MEYDPVVPHRSSGYIIDPKILGERLRGARHAAGYARMPELANAIEDQFGISITSPTLYKYEGGRAVPSLEAFLLLNAVLQPPGGLDYFARAIRPDVAESVFGSP